MRVCSTDRTTAQYGGEVGRTLATGCDRADEVFGGVGQEAGDEGVLAAEPGVHARAVHTGRILDLGETETAETMVGHSSCEEVEYLVLRHVRWAAPPSSGHVRHPAFRHGMATNTAFSGLVGPATIGSAMEATSGAGWSETEGRHPGG